MPGVSRGMHVSEIPPACQSAGCSANGPWAKIGGTGLPVTITFDPRDAAFHRNPHPVLRELRESCPLYFDEGLGVFIATGYEAVRTILSDRRFTPERRYWTQYAPPQWRRPASHAAAAPGATPRHSAVRRLLTLALGREHVDATRSYIREIVDQLVDDLRRKRAFDLVGDFSVDIPARTFLRMLGLPTDAVIELLPLIRTSFEIAEPFLTAEQAQRCADAAVALEAYFTPLVVEREREDRGDMLSRLVATAVQEELTRSEVMATLRSLLNAATQTTPYLIASGMLALLCHPEQLRRLRTGEVSIGAAVEELLRFEGPSKFLFRAAREPVVVSGQIIQGGQAVLASPLAANRDPRIFDQPDVLNLSRETGVHIAFGYGVDACLGARLARLEATIALEALVTRLPTLRVAVDPDGLRWLEVMVIHGLESLPLEL